ncbi:MAG TPA: MFS transporter [Spirochaetes bacterium]|nr:MFS transporter [Spirochaetota bacterium]
MSANNTEKLRLATKIGYGAGDIFGSGAMTIIGFYYLYFLTDVVRISPALAGMAFLISKIWDAVSDPLMGMISDRTRTRFGRRRPYFLAGIFLIAVSFFVMWFPVSFPLEIHRFIYVLAAYLFFSTVITMVMIPYNALASELTVDYNERTSLATYRMIFSGIAGIIGAVVPLEIVKSFDDTRTGYMVMAIVFGLMCALPFIATFLSTFERSEFQREIARQNFSETLRHTFIEPFRVRSFRNVLMMYVFSFLAIDSLMATLIYFMTYYVGKPDMMTPLLGVCFVTQIIFIPVFDLLSKKTSKRNSFITSALIWLATFGYSFIMGPESPATVLFIYVFVVGIGLGGIQVMVFAMFPDIPDIDELKTGERREGVYSGLFTFVRKVSSALAIFIISNSIQIAGYSPPLEQTVDGVKKIVQQAQTAEFLLLLRLIFAFIPAIFLVIAIYNCVRYPLSPEIHTRLRELLSRRKSGGAIASDREAELELKKMLIGKKIDG